MPDAPQADPRFSEFLFLQAQNAGMFLGQIPNPVTGQNQINLRAAKSVEREGGRRPTRRWGPRVIDVDILLFGDLRVHEPGLEIPHPRLLERDFVLAPLRELGVRPGGRS